MTLRLLYVCLQAGPESNDEKLQCLCDHLTSFGGDFLVTPNTIDFDKVALGFANLGKTGNVGVIIAVFVFVLLYVVGVIFARRADRRDKQQVLRTKKALKIHLLCIFIRGWGERGGGGGGQWVLKKILYGAGSSPSSYSLPFFTIRFKYNAHSD